MIQQKIISICQWASSSEAYSTSILERRAVKFSHCLKGGLMAWLDSQKVLPVCNRLTSQMGCWSSDKGKNPCITRQRRVGEGETASSPPKKSLDFAWPSGVIPENHVLEMGFSTTSYSNAGLVLNLQKFCPVTSLHLRALSVFACNLKKKRKCHLVI